MSVANNLAIKCRIVFASCYCAHKEKFNIGASKIVLIAYQFISLFIITLFIIMISAVYLYLYIKIVYQRFVLVLTKSAGV